MIVIILRDVLKEVEVPFKLSDKQAVLVSKLKEARAKDNLSLNCSQDLLLGSSSKKKSTQEVSSDREIIDVNNLKSSPRSPRPKINRLSPNDDRHDEKHFQTIIYHNSRVELLFYDDEKHGKLLLLLHVFFLINIYGAKVITSVLLDYFLFLAYSAIYYYA